MIEAALRLALVMSHDGSRLIDHLSASSTDTEAEVHILDAIAEHLIEATEFEEQFLRHQEARARDHVELTALVHFRRIRRCVARPVVRHAVDELDACVLNRAVGIEQLAANNASPSLPRCREHRLQPARLRLSVVVEEEHELATGFESALIAATSEPEILRVENRAQTSGIPLRFDERHRPISRAVIDDDDLRKTNRRGLIERHETLSGQREVVEGRDDNRDGWSPGLRRNDNMLNMRNHTATTCNLRVNFLPQSRLGRERMLTHHQLTGARGDVSPFALVGHELIDGLEPIVC